MLGGNGSPLHLGGVRCLPLVGGTMAQGASIKWDGRGGLSFSGDGILDVDNAAGSAGARIDGSSGKFYLNKADTSYIDRAGAGQWDFRINGSNSASILGSGFYLSGKLMSALRNYTLAIGDTLAIVGMMARVQGNGGAVTLISTPNIANGSASNGDVYIIIGASDTNTVTFQDEGTLANSGLRLAGGANCTLGLRDVLGLVWDDDVSKWCEMFRSNNT